MKEQTASELRSDATRPALRILIVMPSKIGGTGQYSHNLANALVDAGHQVIFAGPIGFEMARFSSRYELIEVFDKFKPHSGPIRSFLHRVREFRPDIVHFQGAQTPEFYLLLLWLLKRLTRARFVWTPQDVLSNSHRPWHTATLKRVYASMGHVFLNAKQNMDVITDLFGVPANRITVLQMPELLGFIRDELPAELPPELTLDPDRPLVLAFGLIEERKGLDTLIKAFADLRKGGSNAALLIMGAALMDVQSLRDAIAGLALEADVQIIDRYATFEEINGVFGRANHVVMAYHNGWNSGVLITAYGYGKPVIASRVGGFDELVTDGETGFLVPPRDPGALAVAMERVLSDPQAYDAMRAGARRVSEDLNWAEVAAKTTGAYASVLAGEK